MDMRKNEQFIKLFYQTSKNNERVMAHSFKRITPHNRRGLSLQDDFSGLKMIISKPSMIKCNSASNSGIPKTTTTTPRSTYQVQNNFINSNSNYSIDGLQKRNFKESLPKQPQKSLSADKTKEEKKNEKDNEEKIIKKSQSKIEMPASEEMKKLKNNFEMLENCSSELFLNSKYFKSTPFKTALNFYKLLLTLYASIHEISINKFHLLNKTKEDSLNYDSDISNLDVNSNSDGKLLEKSYQNNLKPKSGNDIENDLNRINDDEPIEPLKVDLDKLQIGELLSMPKVSIKSKCIVRTYNNFVEEQYVISCLRKITATERINSATNSVTYKNTISVSVIGSSVSKEFDHQSAQTTSSNSIKSHHACSYKKCDDIPLKLANDKETFGPVNNFQNDDFIAQKKCEFIYPFIYADNLKEMREQKLKNVELGHRTTDNSYQVFPRKEQCVAQMYFVTDSAEIERATIDISINTVNYSKIPSLCNYAKEYLPMLSFGIIYAMGYDVGIISTNDTINSSLSHSYPILKGNTSNKNVSEDLDEKIFESQSEKSLPLPESLISLYERLSKLQNILESIPENNNAAPLVDFDQINSSGSTLCPLSLSDCSVTHDPQLPTGVSDNKNNGQNKLKIDPENFNENLLDEDQSDATTSLSMLENLIDDFLTKNGLKTFSNV